MSFHLAHVESIQTTATGPHQAPHGQLHQMWATKKWSSDVPEQLSLGGTPEMTSL